MLGISARDCRLTDRTGLALGLLSVKLSSPKIYHLSYTGGINIGVIEHCAPDAFGNAAVAVAVEAGTSGSN